VGCQLLDGRKIKPFQQIAERSEEGCAIARGALDVDPARNICQVA